MPVERGDSPLAGRRPAPLSPVADMGSINKLGSLQGLNASTRAAGAAGAAAAAAPASGITANATPGSSVGSGSAKAAKPAASASAASAAATAAAAPDSRSETSFWLELKGVERWFDHLESSERVTLMTSLYSRSSEHQLYQFQSSADAAVRSHQVQSAPTPTSAAAPPALQSELYRYRPLNGSASNLGAGTKNPRYLGSQLSANLGANIANMGANLGASNMGANMGANLGTSNLGASNMGANLGTSNLGASNLGTPNLGTSSLSGKNLGPKNLAKLPNQIPPNSSQLPSNLSTRSTRESTVPPAPAAGAASGSQQGHFFSTFGPASAGAGDLYGQAFLPLPRAQTFSPWGAKIHRPNSAVADVWTDTSRVSPTLTSASASGSPNVSSLSLDAPAPQATSPMAHTLKPWRTLYEGSPPSQSISGHGFAPGTGSASASATATAATAATANAAGTASSVGSGAAMGSAATGSAAGSGASTGNGHYSRIGQVPDPSSGRSASLPTSLGSSPSSSPEKESIAAHKDLASRDPTHLSRLARRGAVNVVDVSLLSDIGAWLRSLRLHKYTDNLSGMRWQDVIHLSDQDLEDRGVNALGARRKLLKIFEEIREAQEAGLITE